MGVKITGLEQLTQRLRSVSASLTYDRRRDEVRAIVGEAEAISPRRTGNFADSWDGEASRTSHTLTITNDAEVDGREYGQYVHRAGESITIAEQVEAIARDRAPALADDMAQIVSDHINGA